MFLKIEKFKKNEEGAALILTILIVGVLFILSSFLVNKVLVNTKIIEKAKEEEESYAIAKEGIVYAVEQLNTSDQATDWPGNPNWNNYNLDNKVNTGDESGNDVRMKVEKDTPPGYITIKSTDLPKKLVTLQGIADYKSPLTKYVRFINSDTTFGDITFGSFDSNAMIQGTTTPALTPTPLCILGDLTWESGSSNDLTLTSDDKAVVYGKITSFDETTTLTINANPPDSGYHYYTDPTNPSDSKLFDTAGGQYFDLAHLPSCYDSSSGSPTFYYGGPRSIFWPEINENIYSSLVGGNESDYYISGTPADEHAEWYPSSFPSSETGWSETYEGSGIYFYTGTGTLVVLDGNGESSGTPEQIGIDDGLGEGTAGNDIIELSEWRSYPSNGLIYSPGNIRILGMIDNDTTSYNLTIVSGGTIYIEGNIVKENDGSSLALLAKDWVTLNPTHKFTGGKVCKMEPEYYDSTGGDIDWDFRPDAPGSSWGTKLSATTGEMCTIAVFDLGYPVLGNRITLKDLTLKQYWTLKIYVSNNKECDKDTVEANDILFGQYGEVITKTTKIFDYPGGTPINFRYIKIFLETTSSTAPTPFQANAITVSLAGGAGGAGGDGTWNGKPLINTLCFAQRKSWAVIPGNGTAYPIVIGGCIAENEFDKDKEQPSGWSGISYRYDSNLSSNLFPPSVNLVSLKRE